MLPAPQLEQVEKNGYEGLTAGQLNDIRSDDLQFNQWRYDSAQAFEYVAGNQFSDEDLQAMSANGIPAVTVQRVAHQVNAVTGMLEGNLTDLRLECEDVAMQDATDALNVKFHEAERTSGFRRANLDAAEDAATGGIGWVEIGRERNPFRPSIRAEHVNWREMYWNLRYKSMQEQDRVRRVRYYQVDRIKASFPTKTAEIDRSAFSTDTMRMWIEPDRLHRQYERNNWRDVPLSWNYSQSAMNDLRLVEEVWNQVQMEGPVVRLPNGRVLEYEGNEANPMIDLALRSGVADLEIAPYSRWWRSFWINEMQIGGGWSPLPFMDCPYSFVWCYREDMTGVPYGLVRALRSIQDAINTLEAKMMFSINAVQTEFEEGAIDPVIWGQQVGRKNGMLPIKPGFFDKVRKDRNLALNEQHFKLYQDLLQQIEIVGGTAGLNPGAMGNGPRSAVLGQQMMLQAMSAIGKFSANCRETKLRSGGHMLELVREDIAKKGSVGVDVKHKSGRRSRVMLHHQVAEFEGTPVISNDVTILNAQMAMEEVPHTATYRAAQMEGLTAALQSLPTNDLDLKVVRLILTANMLESSDIPGAAADAQLIRERTGLVPPQTPQEVQAAQAAAQDAQQQKQLQIDGAMAQIRLTNSRAGEHDAKAQHAIALANSESQPDPIEQESRVVQLHKQAGQVGQIAAKTAHTQAATVLTLHKAQGAAKENATPPPDQRQVPPAQW